MRKIYRNSIEASANCQSIRFIHDEKRKVFIVPEETLVIAEEDQEVLEMMKDLVNSFPDDYKLFVELSKGELIRI